MSRDGKIRSTSKHHFLAGLATGCTSAVLLQPADLLKTRLQQGQSTTLLSTVRGILAHPHGVRNLWRGTLPSVIRTGTGSALYFSTLNALRVQVAAATAASAASKNKHAASLPSPSSALGGKTANGDLDDAPSSHATFAPPPAMSASSTLPTLSKTQNVLTGALARASAGFVMMPITVLKVRYESSLYTYPSLWAATKDILRTHGLRGFFAGYGATAARDAPYAGLYIMFYEAAKVRLGDLVARVDGAATATAQGNVHGGKDDAVRGSGGGRMAAKPGPLLPTSQSMSVNFVSGALAAVMATTVTNPFDAIKTRIQLMPGKYGNMFLAARMMVRGEGVRSLFDGLGLRVGRKALSSALAWTGYEELVRRVEGRVVAKE